MISPTVSIILPNRNYAAFIPDAIASIKAQILTDWECIIIDDASTDNSVDVIKSLIADDNRFKLVTNQEPIGISAARNIGLELATGEYISFLDSDDCYTEYFLEMLVQLARKANVEIAGALSKRVDGDFHFKLSDTKWNTDDYVIYEDPLDMAQRGDTRKWIWIWRKIYKRSLFKEVHFHNEMKVNGDDVIFMLDLQWRVPRIAESNIDGVYHRVHNTSISNTNNVFNLERIKMFPILFKHIRENLVDKYDKKFWNYFYNAIFLSMLIECIIRFADYLTEQDKKDIKKVLRKSCRLIVKRLLPFKNRLLCRYLAWIM